LDVTAVEETRIPVVNRSLLAACPNPTVRQSIISYSLERDARVGCAVYDAAGNLVSRLAAGAQAAGAHRLIWNAEALAPGVYFCQLTGDGVSATTRLTRAQ
jgi:hypothetical protein